MKRRALVILTVAILAFAMIPALGANAGEGDVAIVTPDELASPDGTSGADFSRLEEAEFVSTQTGTDTNLQDASGTLFIVIEDNDDQSNTLQRVSAIYGNPQVTNMPGGHRFYVRPGADGGTSNHSVATVLVDGAANPVTDVTNVVIADGNRDGDLDGRDITVQTGAYTAAIVGSLPGITPVILPVKASFMVETTLTGVPVYSIADNGQFATLDGGGIASTADIRITFSTSKTDSLIDADTDRSLVEVRSTSGESINVIATEKDISGYRALELGGINAASFAGSDSQDSGIFVAMIGLIDNDWKLMISEWVTDDSDENSPLLEGETTLPLIPGTDTQQLVDAGRNAPASTQTVEVLLNGTNAPGTTAFLYDRSTDGEITKLDLGATFVAGEGSTSRVTAAVTDVQITSGVATAFVTLTGIADDTSTTDKIVVDYEVTGSVTDLIAAITAAGADPAGAVATTHSAFDDLCALKRAGAECPEALKLTDAIEAHTDNLGLTRSSTGASIFANKVVGVSDGDDLDVRYSDPTPGEGTQRASAVVDTTAPTIGGFDPSDDSFNTDDRFRPVFTVVDAGSGMFEDAEEIDLLDDVNYVEASIVTRTPGGSDSTRDSLDTEEDEDVNDGFLYEVEIDVREQATEAEDEDENLEVVMTVVAYDIARNRASKTVTFTVDVIDPELLGAITGWGVTFSSDVDRAAPDDNRGAYILQEGQLDAIALVFNGPVDGSSVRANNIVIGGKTTSSITWLDNEGGNVITIGSGSTEPSSQSLTSTSIKPPGPVTRPTRSLRTAKAQDSNSA